MNISAQRFATKTPTWLLIAGLTALLVGIGALLGGMFLWVFVAIAVATNVIGYWFSDRLALKVRRAQPVEPARNRRSRPQCRTSRGARRFPSRSRTLRSESRECMTPT